MITKNKSLLLLNKYFNNSGDNSVVNHSLAVSNNARRIAKKIKENGYEVDVNFIEIAALLHDIGRSKSHGTMHGIIGAKIIMDELGDEKIARVCKTHIGAGIAKDETKKLQLPKEDYLPETLEEKIIAHADNITFGTELAGIDKVLEKFERKLGKNHPSVNRIGKLNEFIEKLLTTTAEENKIIENFKKEVMEKDVLNKIKWDQSFDPGDFSIHYPDRITGQLKQVNFNDIQIEGDFMKTNDSMIPMHRIREIKYKNKIVWNKRRI